MKNLLVILIVLIFLQTGKTSAQTTSDSTNYFISWISHQKDNSISAGNIITKFPSSWNRQTIWTAMMKKNPEMVYVITCIAIGADNCMDVRQANNPAKLEIEYVILSPVFGQGRIQISTGTGTKVQIEDLKSCIKKSEGQNICVLTNFRQIN